MKKFKLNPDADHVTTILEGITSLNGHCPCVPAYTHSEDTICPCKNFREKDECHCELFVEDV
jgi:ferredoxin-thioredoxin reductase catalytic subunit